MIHLRSFLHSLMGQIFDAASSFSSTNLGLARSTGSPLDLTAKPVSQVNGVNQNKLRNQIRRLASNYVTSTVPLSWVATTPTRPFANLGDALSPVIVSALSGLPIVHRHFDSKSERFACVGTIGQEFKGGTAHFWGTGIDAYKNPIDRQLKRYHRPPDTAFRIHALRGPVSAQTFRREGIEAPEIYGDPVWFLPSLIKPSPVQSCELGIVVHLTELSEQKATASTHESILRYKIPSELATNLCIINTLIEPTFEAIEQKVKEITACKRIISTSLHGLVIAEAYKIPCLYLLNCGGGTTMLHLENETEVMDQRIRDFYSGVGLKTLIAYAQKRNKATNWQHVIQAIDAYWEPLEWHPEPFLEAFPLPLKFNPLQASGSFDRTLFNCISF